MVYTRPRAEKKVAFELNRSKIKAFLPTVKTLRIWWDRKKYVDEPLFPSYVFVYLNNNLDYHNSACVPGVLDFVRTGKHIQMVADTVVNNLMILTCHSNELEVSSVNFMIGQQLVIGHGPLTGLQCEIVRIDNKRKLLVRVDLLQRNVLLNISADHLIPLSKLDLLSQA